MFLGGYLGIGLVLTAQTAMDSINHHGAAIQLNSDLLAIPLMIAFFTLTALRLVFDMPAALNANWIFRSILENPSPDPRRPVRKIMLLCVFTWQLALLFPLMFFEFGWQTAVLHTIAVMLLSATLVEFLLARFHKIPFTCSSRPDIRTLLMRILGAVFAVIALCSAGRLHRNQHAPESGSFSSRPRPARGHVVLDYSLPARHGATRSAHHVRRCPTTAI